MTFSDHLQKFCLTFAQLDWHSETPAEELPIADPFMAVGGGYGESKYVAERILDGAAKTTPLKPIVVRIGQLSGGKNGSWNTSEWLPSVVRSGEVVGRLPASDDVSLYSFPFQISVGLTMNDDIRLFHGFH